MLNKKLSPYFLKAIQEETGWDGEGEVVLKDSRKDPKVGGCYVVLADVGEKGKQAVDQLFIINDHTEDGCWEVYDCGELDGEEDEDGNQITKLSQLTFGEPRFF